MTAPTTRRAHPTALSRSIPPWRRPGAAPASRILALCLVLFLVSGCGWVSSLFGGKKTDAASSVSVFKVVVGQCFNPPAKPVTDLSDLSAVPCTTPHTQEAYAEPAYVAPAGADSSVYPGADPLVSFAKGACAQAFTSYVGVSYLDSSLFFTYLLPSARSWESGKDRTILCFVTTTGKPLTTTVKGSKL
ncbi:Septum formation [Nakamurella panacisegetis]|uniref:Septum formation n=1 Tax=Nakamurella panacisegetis TaxID=1090615 RepID=A0A1H0JJX0_9ACTN|nr:septum formation family protein [Nakamurella panacisegetis]SDO43862.1 Septum formation [Nakamurella panacisegetis]